MEKTINRKIDNAHALNEKIVSSIADEYVSNIHSRYRTVSSTGTDDVYSSVQNLGYKLNSERTFTELNHRLKRKSRQSAKAELLQKLLDEYSLEQQVYEQEYLRKQIEEYRLAPTPNKNFMVNPEGKYFRINDGCFIEESGVIKVNDDASYIVQAQLSRGTDIIVTTYNNEDRPVAIKIVNQKMRAYETEIYVAKKLNMKKEYVNKYKLHGYSGNASGFWAMIKNLLTKPIPSGCYLHENFNFYKWSLKNSQFEIQLRQGVQVGSPMLADYDINESSVIRTDYDGVGIYL